jgi:putative ABC transport system permease protein
MNLFRNLQFALRMVRKNPAVAISAVLAIALGVGATSAMFSAVDGILLNPLPFPGSERLVNVWETAPSRDLQQLVVAPGNYYDWRTQNHVFSAIGAYQQAAFNLASREGEPERFLGAICDADFFTTLGVKPVLGRNFARDEDQPGHSDVVVLGYSVWQQRFGASREVLGQKLNINGRPRTVIGVMPAGFEYPQQAVMWSPLGFDAETRERRDFHRLRVIGRLKDGVTLEGARAEFRTIAARLAEQYPDLNRDESVLVNPVLADLVGPVRNPLLVLLGAVFAVLLIACANVANLLLAKASGRHREIAVRAAMGASRRTILGQMLTESLVLAILGGAAGIVIAQLALNGLVALAPPNTPRLDQVVLNWRVAGLGLALSMATGILFGLAPAWYASRVDVSSLLKEGGRGNTSRNRLRSVLVVAQVAITLVLLAGAGLLTRSFYEVAHVDAGFDPEHLMTMRMAPAVTRFGEPARQIQLARGILAKVGALPGVRQAAVATDLPMLGNPIFIMRFEGRPPVTPSQSPLANYFAVTPTFFDSMKMRLLRGRLLTEWDLAGSPLVAVVNQTLVDRYFHNEDPIGKQLEIGFDDPPAWRQIVGVVADVKTAGLDRDTPVQVYGAYFQIPTFPAAAIPQFNVLARTAGDPANVGPAMQAAILSLDRSQPVYAIQPMTTVVARSIAQRRLSLVLLAFFAASALALAAIGVFGVMSFVVTLRTPEIGIRMALGAQPTQVTWQVESQAMRLVAAGLAVGAAAALLLTKYLHGMLFRVSERDPAVFGIAIATLLITSAVACWIPARRAARVDPIAALRTE